MGQDVHLVKKPERKHTKTYRIPNDIKRPPASTMEPVYDDGNYLYAVMPFLMDKAEELGRLMLGVSFLYYAIAYYERDTGRFLGSGYGNTDKKVVEQRFSKFTPYLSKIEDPYYLYHLRISHGYYY